MIFRALFLAILLLWSSPAWTAETSTDTADYSYGEIIRVEPEELTVLEYDYELDEERTVPYKVNAKTVLTNIAKLTELTKGDTVEVYFNTDDGVRTAQMIIKDDAVNPVDDQTPAP